jgi:poly-beta-hydroxyalkanoate depolymerase
VFDLGYLGVGKDIPDQKSSLTNRKKRSQKDLSQEEKEHNRIHSRKRTVIEHTICRMKKYRIMSDVFRNSLKKYDKVSDMLAGMATTGHCHHLFRRATSVIAMLIKITVSDYAIDLLHIHHFGFD